MTICLLNCQVDLPASGQDPVRAAPPGQDLPDDQDQCRRRRQRGRPAQGADGERSRRDWHTYW